MTDKLTDRGIAKLPTPSQSGNRVFFDSEVGGLGVRVTAAGARSFVLCYRNRAGRQRRLTIGSFGEWTIGAARAEARELRRKIDQGDDPLGAIRAGREAPTVADLCDRFSEEYLPKKRPLTQRDYRRIIEKEIIPAIGSIKVSEVAFDDIDRLHRKITKRGATYAANRCVALLSKIFALAIRWKYRADNPCKGIERNQEEKRERFLSVDELNRLGEALENHEDQQSANLIRLLLLTGARSGEVRAMRWRDLDLKAGVWTKPSAHTKQKKSHRVPLSAPARDLLAALRGKAEKGAEYVFPGKDGGHQLEFKRAFATLCKAAKIKGCRPHDLRHSYASVLVSNGFSLPVIGRLLGHTQAATTQRYAHLADDPLRVATEKAGSLISGKR